MALTDPDFGGDVYDAPVGPPTGLVYVAAAVLAAAVALSVFTSTPARIAAYVLSAMATSIVVGVFRFLDGQRRSRATYRISRWPGVAAVALLVAAWAVSCADAWLLATAWSR